MLPRSCRWSMLASTLFFDKFTFDQTFIISLYLLFLPHPSPCCCYSTLHFPSRGPNNTPYSHRTTIKSKRIKMKYTLLFSALACVSANHIEVQDYTCIKQCNKLYGREACIKECEAKRREESQSKDHTEH